ncbi:hypothetical protein D0N87_07460 [Pseudomonas sp. ATCC 13867]|nr:hypothetical protein D0N87_07460 [Pseudomonas sp. ATCC 13867]
MQETHDGAWQRVLQDVTTPFDRVSEMAYGVIMTLTIISVISAASGGASRQDLIVAALGCNLAWGLVDALMLLVRLRVEGAHRHGRCAPCAAPRTTPTFATGSTTSCRPGWWRSCGRTRSGACASV